MEQELIDGEGIEPLNLPGGTPDISGLQVVEGGGVSIDDCVALSRFIESRLDRDKEDFSLMVGSAGI